MHLPFKKPLATVSYVYFIFSFHFIVLRVCFNNDKLIDVCLNQVLLLLFLTASSDTRPNICSNNTGCCNKTIENEMKAQITKKLMNLIQRHNEKARRQFKDVYDDLKGKRTSNVLARLGLRIIIQCLLGHKSIQTTLKAAGATLNLL